MIRTKVNITFGKIIPGFLAEKSISVAKKTLCGYVGRIKVLTNWLYSKNLQRVPLNKITKFIINDFSIYLATIRKLDKPTCEKYLLDLQGIFKYATKRDYLQTVAPLDLFILPKKGPDMGAVVIIPEHLKLILPEMKEKDPQLYLASMFIYYCFIRPRRELRLLKIKDINFIDWAVCITSEHAKNGHQRILTMPLQLIELCKVYKLEKWSREFYIFGKKRKPGRILNSVNMFSYRFNKIRERFHLTKKYKFYSFKHTGGTALHNARVVSIRDEMDHFGHANLNATLHYLKKHGGTINENIRDFFPSPLPVMKRTKHAA